MLYPTYNTTPRQPISSKRRKTRKEVKTMTNTNKTKQCNQENKRNFETLLREYEVATMQGNNEKQLLDLSTAIAYSVVKKCLDVSQNPQLRSVKNDITRDNKHLQALVNVNENTFSLGYNQDGDLIQVVNDKALQQAFDKLVQQRLGDGLDLVNTAVLALLDETEKQRGRDNGLAQENWLEVPYQIRQLKRKVYIKLEDSVNGWETVNVTPIQRVYKAVRQEIENSRAMSTDARNGYTYLEEYATDEDGETETRIYKRLPKYSDLGGYACDFNGKETLYSANATMVEDIDGLIESLELSVQQAKVLQLRLQGKGYKAIATYLGVKQCNVATQIYRIREKAIANGLQPK